MESEKLGNAARAAIIPLAAPTIQDGLSDASPRTYQDDLARAILKPRKSKPFFGRHPWVLDTAIARIETPHVANLGLVGRSEQATDIGTSNNSSDDSPNAKIQDEAVGGTSDVVDLISDAGKWIARGIVNRRSRIRIRLYTWDEHVALDRSFWAERINAAIQLRKRLGLLGPEKACRLVFSEADGLSGLIADYYAGYLAIQPTAKGIADRLSLFVDIFRELIPVHAVLVKPERTLVKQEGVALQAGTVWGNEPSGPIFIQEHGLRWGVDLSAGQKTGFYLDQRENRLAVAGYAEGRSVLDMFCYTGGFAIAAAKLGKAKEVTGFDASASAIETAKANALLNHVHHAQFHSEDCFDALDRMVSQGRKFGMVILDPPKFASDAASVASALSAYHRLNRQAVNLLEPGGVLATCCCTGRISRDEFLDMLSGVAQQSRRPIQLLEYRGAAADHPVSLTAREGEYLKCCICSIG